jgi:antirestriction protein ArdC
MTTSTIDRKDVYTRVTERIIADLAQGIRPWLKPWSAGNTEGRITRPLRHNGTPYQGINILLLWGETIAKGYAANTWMTYKQAEAIGAQVRKGEHGSLVVFADRFTKTETADNGEAIEREIPFMKAYTVFNVEQIDGLPARYQPKPETKGEPLQLIGNTERFFAATGATFRHGGNRAYYAPAADIIQLPAPEAFKDAESYAATKAHEPPTGRNTRAALTVISAASASAMKATPAKSLSPNLAPLSSVPILASPPSPATITPPISGTGSRCCRTTSAPYSRPPPTHSAPSIISTDRKPPRPSPWPHKRSTRGAATLPAFPAT